MAILSKGRCPKCSGFGTLPVAGPPHIKMCQRCHGTGKAALTEQESALANTAAYPRCQCGRIMGPCDGSCYYGCCQFYSVLIRKS
jgi:DnaJ-class molecular chaperone